MLEKLQNASLSFEEKALLIFDHQMKHNLSYRQYLQKIGLLTKKINTLDQIPFLPIELFKYREICTTKPIEMVFESSGTTDSLKSKHYVSNLKWYEQVSKEIFKTFYGHFSDFHFLALLPSYLERKNASLVYMMNTFIQESQSNYSNFYLDNPEDLMNAILQINKNDVSRKILLVGVTFALLDLAEKWDKAISSKDLIIMETGGMKGRKKELLREEVHQKLKNSFNVETIHSEYGMTELLSQAYSKGDGLYQCHSWIRIFRRNLSDPFEISQTPGRGGLNIIDLANVNSCSFIQTDDLVEIIDEQTFKILGRIDHADIRGCNQMFI